MSRISAHSLPITAMLATSIALSLGSAAQAQTDQDRARARSAATAGAQAFSASKYADALDLFSRAESLLHAPTHLLYIGRAQAAQGHLVAAREAYLKVVKETLPEKAPQAFREAQSAATTELAQLEPRLPTLTVVVDGPGAKDAQVVLDGEPVPAVSLGLPSPADPGTHEVSATVPGRPAVTARVSLTESAKETVKLTVETPLAAPVAASGPADTGPQSSGGSGMKIAAYASLGVGVVGLGVGTVFALKRSSALSDADKLCSGPGGACGESHRAELDSLDSDARSAGTISLIGFGVGAAGVATGVTLLLLGGKSAPSQTSARVEPFFGPRSVGVTGRF